MKVTAHYRDGRKAPWEARWWVNRQMRTRFFETEDERNRFIKNFSREIIQHGEEVYKFDKNRMRRWQEADLIAPDVDPVEMARHWVATHEAAQLVTLKDGVARFLKELELAGRTKEYRAHVREYLKRFASEFGEAHVSAITSTQVSDFIHALPFSAITKRHARSGIVSAYKWFVKQGWAEKNPAAAVPVPKVDLAEPGILSVEETEHLFRANEAIDPEICGLLALGAFAGMRASAIARLDSSELDFASRAILTPASKTKKGRRHYMEGLPANLWAWLERTPKTAFKMEPRTLATRRENAFRRAGLLVTSEDAKRSHVQPKAPPKNCLRHSFVSYHVALHRDPGRTALLVSHKDQSILWNHYLGVAKREDAERYFAILPMAVE